MFRASLVQIRFIAAERIVDYREEFSKGEEETKTRALVIFITNILDSRNDNRIIDFEVDTANS